MTPEEIENCWQDPSSWKRHIYYCKADPRVIVPRRLKWMGWTLNFARPSSVPVLLGMMALLIVPAVVIRANGGGTVANLVTGILSIAVVCVMAAHLSSTKRWNR